MEQTPLVDAIAKIPVFADLPREQLAWLAGRGEDLRLEPGDVLFREGEPAIWMYVIVEGEIQAQRAAAGLDVPVYFARAGEVSGVLPFSRMKVFGGTGRAVLPSRVARFGTEIFPEMTERLPVLVERLVGTMSDRVREVAKLDQQRDKLMALGKLSAGLAHELNNPAAAAGRAARLLREMLGTLRDANERLDTCGFSVEQREFLAAFERRVAERTGSVPPLDPLARSDREEELTAWLDDREVGESWELAPTLVEAGLSADELDEVDGRLGRGALGDVLVRLAARLSTERLVGEIESSTGRISELVGAIKEYSYMDQAPVQEIEVHQGIETTLVMLGNRLKNGVDVVRDYDRDLPRIQARGGELNQVWTNLIDNAIDAMSGKGELRVRTSREYDHVLVEITDDGVGIPPELQSRVFEPFFTTKHVGEGTGLGLDTVYRIVRRHHGTVELESSPEGTTFRVRLPISAT